MFIAKDRQSGSSPAKGGGRREATGGEVSTLAATPRRHACGATPSLAAEGYGDFLRRWSLPAHGLALAVALASPAQAQGTASDDCTAASEQRDNLITVVANGSPLRLDTTGQPIAIIDTRELESIQGADLTRALERLPGVSFSRNGGLGAQTGLNVRGANADQVLVLVDGVRVADYASPGGSYDLGNLMMDGVSRVDLLRGSNSVVWGSQAIGGVLAVQMREIDGAEVSGEYGAYDTWLAHGGVGIADSGYAASLTAGYARTDGFSALAAGTEADGYHQWNVAGKGRVMVASGLTLRANARYARSKLDIDLTGANAPDHQLSKEGSGRVGFDYSGSDLTLTGGAALSTIRRDYETGWGPSFFKGSGRRVDLAGQVNLDDTLKLDFGTDSEWTRAQSSYDTRQKARASSGHALLGYNSGAVSLVAGARLDDHSRFGSHWTFGANGSLALGEGWRLRASYGEGFKAPTLYQLYGSFVGNTALKPEQSRSYDVGIEQGDRNGMFHAALTLFRRDSRDLIDLSSAYVYANTARARAQGVEVELGARPDDNLRVQAAYTYTRARDLTLNRDLARRPRHLLTLSGDWQTPLRALTIGGDVRLASDAVEYDWMGAPTRLDGYVLGTIRAQLALGERFELYGRVENIGNARYETAAGFGTPGRSAYAGIRARF